MTDVISPTGHVYDSYVVKEAICEQEGKRHHACEHCADHYDEVIPALGHNYIITDVIKAGKTTKRTWTCTHCGDNYIDDLGNQYEKVTSYVELLFNRYSPYMIWVLLATAGVWSIFIGISIIIAQKNEEKEKSKRMLINYGIGLIAIFFILVACPYLIRGIAALVT